MNPYQQVISVCARTLEPFDDDHLIPCYGFGDITTKDAAVFPFYPNETPCNGVAYVALYVHIAEWENGVVVLICKAMCRYLNAYFLLWQRCVASVHRNHAFCANAWSDEFCSDHQQSDRNLCKGKSVPYSHHRLRWTSHCWKANERSHRESFFFPSFYQYWVGEWEWEWNEWREIIRKRIEWMSVFSNKEISVCSYTSNWLDFIYFVLLDVLVSEYLYCLFVCLFGWLVGWLVDLLVFWVGSWPLKKKYIVH